MTKRVRVEVTAEDIKRGKPGDPCLCPVARAIRRAFRSRHVSVTCIGAAVRGHVFLFSKRIERLVNAIDGRLPVRPFSFTLTLPGDALGEEKKL